MTRIRLATLFGAICLLPIAAAGQIDDGVRSHVARRIANSPEVAISMGFIDSTGAVTYFGAGPREVGGTDTVNEHTVFEIGSITKTFTGLLLADMATRRALGLDDPVRVFLPSHVTMPSKDGASITLRHLSTHRSSLPRLPGNLRPSDTTNPYADYTVDQMYEWLSGYTPSRDIGSNWNYSNLAVGLLGHVLALRAGDDLETVYRDRLLDPLGMIDTGIDRPDSQADRAATGHANGQPVPDWDIPTLAGAGALRSTVADMVKYVAAHLGHENTRLADAIALATSEHDAGLDSTFSMGLGWIRAVRGDNRDQLVLWHNGGTGGYRSFAGFDPARRVGVVVLSNSTESVDDLGMFMLDRTAELPSYDRVDVPEAVLESYTGDYQLTPQMVLGIRTGPDGLIAQATGQSEVMLLTRSATEFYNTSIGAEVEFVQEGGEVVALILRQGGQEIRAPKIR